MAAQEAPQKHIVAEEFPLGYRNGTPRARFSLRADGEPALSLSDRHGRKRLRLQLIDEGWSRVELRPHGSKLSATGSGSRLRAIGHERAGR